MDISVLSSINMSVLLVFVLAFLICYFYLGRKTNLPPGPRGLPFIGGAMWMNSVREKRIPNYKALMELSKTRGDVIACTVFGRMFVYLHGFDTIRDVFVKNAEVVSDRPSWLPGLKEAATKEGKGVIWQSGNAWKVLRKFVLQTLRDFGVGKTSLEEKIMQEVDAVTEVLNQTEGKPGDVKSLTSMMITNVIYGIVFAKRFDFDDELLHQIIENLDELFKHGGFAPQRMTPIFLLKVFNKKGYTARQQRLQAMAWIKEHIYEEIKNHESTFDNENIRDFIDLYIQTKSERSEENIFNKGNMFRVIMDLFIAGSETTSNTVNWSILYMQEYPEIQKKCQDEIFEKFGDRIVTWADRGSLPYVGATLLEIQRIANIAPFSVPHTNEVDTFIGGYFIPRRSLIFANLYSAHMDPKHWDKPEVFNPERFLDGGKLKKNSALIPFSTGPRVCLGESLAKMEMFLIFTNLLQRFNFCRGDSVRHTFDRVFEQTTSAPVPYNTCAVKRA